MHDGLYRTTMPGAMARHAMAGLSMPEILAVMAIIAVLVGILVPTLNTIKRKADGTRCSNIIRQCVAANLSYATDNRSCMPYSNVDDSTGATHY